MGTFKEILDTLRGIEGEVADFITNDTKHTSLAKSSLEGTFNFPVIVSNAMTIEDANLVSRALERQFASMTLTVLTMNPHFNTMGTTPSAANYLKKYHQNMDTKANGTDVVNTVTSFLREASDKLDIDYDESVMEDVKHFMVAKVYEGINSPSIIKENLRFNYTIEEVTELSILNSKFSKRKVVTEDTVYNTQSYDLKGDANINIPEVNVRVTNSGMGGGLGGMGGGRNKVDTPRPMQHLLDNDVKKANELVPTLLHVRVYPFDRNQEVALQPIDFVVGVKATLHPVSSEEMILNIARGIKNDSKMFNFIRWTTGEIKFMRDFVLGVNELKLDAVNNGSKTSKWWTMLKRRKSLSKIKNVVLPNKLLPNATIIITKDEVDVLNKQYGYDLTKSYLVDKLMQSYFLIAFVIVDPALQRVSILFDGKTEFETLTFAGLARENQVDDRKFKEMMNMLGRRM